MLLPRSVDLVQLRGASVAAWVSPRKRYVGDWEIAAQHGSKILGGDSCHGNGFEEACGSTLRSDCCSCAGAPCRMSLTRVRQRASPMRRGRMAVEWREKKPSQFLIGKYALAPRLVHVASKVPNAVARSTLENYDILSVAVAAGVMGKSLHLWRLTTSVTAQLDLKLYGCEWVVYHNDHLFMRPSRKQKRSNPWY